MHKALAYTLYGDSFTINVDDIPAYVAEMRAMKGVSDIEFCETVELDNDGRVWILINGRGEVVTEFDYDHEN